MDKLNFNLKGVMAGLMISLFLSALDNSIVATAIPKIIKSLGGMKYYSLPFTSYLLLSTVLIPIGGKLSDIYGRKKIMTISIIAFIISSVLCGLSQNMIMLIAFRGLQGASGGVVASSTFIICSSIFPPRQRSKYIGIMASVHGLASILGPVIGGLLTDYLSWHWIFFINLPIGIVAVYFIKRYIPILEKSKNEELDYKSIIYFLLAIVPILICLTELNKSIPFGSIIFISIVIFSTIFLILFIANEKKSISPLLPKSMLKESVFLKSSFTAACAYGALFGMIIYIPYLLQTINKETASFSGAMMIPMSLAIVFGGMIGGKLISKNLKFRKQGALNLIISSIGMFILFIYGLSINYYVLAIGIILSSFGIGMNFPTVNIAPQSVFDKSKLGIVISSLEFIQIMGGVIASSIYGNMLGNSSEYILLISFFLLLIGAVSIFSLDEKRIQEGFKTQH
ncbi:MAG: MFS transporter [Marinifilaceae bacterium]|jgi:EmrB/QacA subfamily drug resistance transporter|nr:MFS transporter [Marinifilaceae bacterium]